MKPLIKKLIEKLFSQESCRPSPIFTENSYTYIYPLSNEYITTEDITTMLKQKSYRSYTLYTTLKPNPTLNNLCYVLVRTSSLTPSIMEEIVTNLQKAALGFKLGYFSERSISLLKGRVPTHVYELVFRIYQHACIYLRLKQQQNFKSMAWQYFYNLVSDILVEYEKAVVSQPQDVLGFYVGMYRIYIRLQIVHQINECFCDNPTKPFEFLRTGVYANHPFYTKIMHNTSKHLNDCLRKFLRGVQFNDEYKEFFIRCDSNAWDGFSVDENVMPSDIEEPLVEKILYVGKCMNLLRRVAQVDENNQITCGCSSCVDKKIIRKHCLGLNSSVNQIKNSESPISKLGNDGNFSEECIKQNLDIIFDIAKDIDILDINFKNSVDILVKNVDVVIKTTIFEKLRLYELLGCIQNVFMNKRSDFMESLFLSFKDLKSSTKKSYSYVLDSAVSECFPNRNLVYSNLDVFIHDDENSYDNFSLFINLGYPLNLIIDKDIVLNLSKIYKFLWIIKRVEHLLRKSKDICLSNHDSLKITKYLSVLQTFYFYIYEEVITTELDNVLKTGCMFITRVKKGLDAAILTILDRLCLKREKNSFFQIIKNLENVLLACISKSAVFDDSGIKIMFLEMIEANRDVFDSTVMYDLEKFFVI